MPADYDVLPSIGKLALEPGIEIPLNLEEFATVQSLFQHGFPDALIKADNAIENVLLAAEKLRDIRSNKASYSVEELESAEKQLQEACTKAKHRNKAFLDGVNILVRSALQNDLALIDRRLRKLEASHPYLQEQGEN